MITIVDYEMGNPKSIMNMLSRLGIKSQLSRNVNDILQANKLILPGVGAFDAAMLNLKKFNLIESLNKKVLEEQVPILGICLGMQLLTNSSEEGVEKGLGWIDAQTKKFDNSLGIKVPHMGWNYIFPKATSPICRELNIESRFYFVHSYYVQANHDQNSCMKSNYSVSFDSAIEHNNIYGVQFHPEKSHKFGMQLLKNFADL